MYAMKEEVMSEVSTLEAPKTYKHDVIGMASIHAYTHIPFSLLHHIDVSRKNGPIPRDSRDQLMSLLSSLVINGPASGVSPRPGMQTASNGFTAQVLVTHIVALITI
jgi:hypothetical protein